LTVREKNDAPTKNIPFYTKFYAPPLTDRTDSRRGIPVQDVFGGKNKEQRSINKRHLLFILEK